MEMYSSSYRSKFREGKKPYKPQTTSQSFASLHNLSVPQRLVLWGVLHINNLKALLTTASGHVEDHSISHQTPLFQAEF